MQIIECEQRSPEWYKARLGIPTSSEFKTILAHGRKKGDPSLMRQTYMNKLAGEILTGEPMDSFTNAHMERGQQMEEDARNFYTLTSKESHEPQLVGFVRHGMAGASPDALLGDTGVLEIKTQLPHLLIPTLRKEGFPPEHTAQCQGLLWVTERTWLDLVIYWPGLPLFKSRVTRDDAYIGDLEVAVDRFCAELREVVEEVKDLA